MWNAVSATTILQDCGVEAAQVAAGSTERSSSNGHCTCLTTFSAIEPKTSGRQPEMPCVEITIMSICSRSIISMMFPTTSLPISMLELALIPLETRAASHVANCRSALPSAWCRYSAGDSFCAHWKHGNNVQKIEFSMKVLGEVGCGLQSGIR